MVIVTFKYFNYLHLFFIIHRYLLLYGIFVFAQYFVSPPHCVRRIRLTKKCEHEKIGPQNSDQSSFLKWPHHNRLEFYHKIVQNSECIFCPFFWPSILWALTNEFYHKIMCNHQFWSDRITIELNSITK